MLSELGLKVSSKIFKISMTLDFLLLIITFRYLQTHLQTKTLYPEKKDLFFNRLLFSIALLIVGIVISSVETFAQWLALLLNFGLVYEHIHVGNFYHSNLLFMQFFRCWSFTLPHF
jgi:hypothetical protein